MIWIPLNTALRRICHFNSVKYQMLLASSQCDFYSVAPDDINTFMCNLSQKQLFGVNCIVLSGGAEDHGTLCVIRADVLHVSARRRTSLKRGKNHWDGWAERTGSVCCSFPQHKHSPLTRFPSRGEVGGEVMPPNPWNPPPQSQVESKRLRLIQWHSKSLLSEGAPAGTNHNTIHVCLHMQTKEPLNGCTHVHTCTVFLLGQMEKKIERGKRWDMQISVIGNGEIAASA